MQAQGYRMQVQNCREHPLFAENWYAITYMQFHEVVIIQDAASIYSISGYRTDGCRSILIRTGGCRYNGCRSTLIVGLGLVDATSHRTKANNA